ncbi:MAG: GAF domain-containing SpoIIE family protein phosphatase [Planctomycetota bacterium]
MSGHTFLTGDRVRDQRNVDLLLDAVVELYGTADLATRVRRAVDRAIRVTGAERGILLLGDAAGEPVPHTARDGKGADLPKPLTYSRTAVRDVWTTRAPKLMTGTDSGQAFDPSKSALALKLRSILAVPLVVGDRGLGVLYVDSRFVTKEFTDGDRAVFEALAGLVSVALEQSRLADEEAERKRLAAEMDAARRIQQSFLPRDLPSLPGYDVATLSRPCVETSGDYLDVVALDGGRVGLAVGDVSGHGLPAALFMTSARALLRGLLHADADPAAVFARINAYLCHDLPDDGFMSFFLGILDPASRTLSWVSAGHNPPLLRRADGTTTELRRTGTVFGIDDEARYAVHGPVPFGPGDALLVYTDGLFEARAPDGRGEWGEEAMSASFGAHVAAGRTSQGVLDGLVTDLAAHVGSRPLDDDVTGLVVRGV